MNIVRCENGHFYDEGKYARCPFCYPDEGRSGSGPAGSAEGGVHDWTDEPDIREAKPRAGSESFLKWKDAEQAADENRTMMEYEPDADLLLTHCFVTGWLVCVEGPERGRDYRIRYGFNQIGRSHRMDICIFEDDKISRNTHCCIVYEDRQNQFLLLPGKGSLTWKDDAIVEEPVRLVSGDRFRIGDTVLEFIAFCRDDIKWEK